MNQILDYNPNKNSGGGTPKSDKIVRIFAIILAIFAICLLIGGAYGIYKNKKESNTVAEAPTEAKISTELLENEVLIKVSHDKAIEKLIYNWDSDKETTLKGDGKSSMESKIPVIAGNHTLTVKVTDINGVETFYTEEITSENGEDKIKPRIDLKVIEGPKIQIIATDETAIDFITYRWNDEEEQKVEVSEENGKEIICEIDILKGQNDLVVIAVDKNNNTTHENGSFTGVTEPKVSIVIASDKKSAEVTCTHENGLKEVKVIINGEESLAEINEEENKTVTFTIGDINEENTTIKIIATSVDDTQKEVEETIQQDAPAIEIKIEETENPEEALATINSVAEIKEIQLNINGEDYTVDDFAPNNTTIEGIPLVQGENIIKIKVIDINDGEKEEVKEITR